MRKIMVCCAALAACFSGGSTAIAAATSAVSTATLTISNAANICTVKGAKVSMGTYKSNDTLQTVADQLGYQAADYNIRTGTNGVASVNLGSVTCQDGVDYTIGFLGTGDKGNLELILPNGKVRLHAMIKRLGDTIIPDGASYFNGFGKSGNPNVHLGYEGANGGAIGATGNGKEQVILGNVIVSILVAGTGIYDHFPTEQLGAEGAYTSTWTSQVNF